MLIKPGRLRPPLAKPSSAAAPDPRRWRRDPQTLGELLPAKHHHHQLLLDWKRLSSAPVEPKKINDFYRKKPCAGPDLPMQEEEVEVEVEGLLPLGQSFFSTVVALELGRC